MSGNQPVAVSAAAFGGMRAITNRLLTHGPDEDYRPLSNRKACELVPDGRGWWVHVREPDGTRCTVRADAVVITQPATDVLELLDASRVELSEPVRMA